MSTGLLLLTGSWLPLAIALPGFALLAISLVTAWNFCGRQLIGPRELGQIPAHMARVARSIFALALGRKSAWVRADRTRSGPRDQS
jgi:hypothetical protein